ncbi:unnamed protein product, partial [Brenthis ino]
MTNTDIKTITDSLELKIRECVKQEMSTIKEHLTSTVSKPTQPSYAQVTSSPVPFKVPKTKHTAIVTATNPLKSKHELLKSFQEEAKFRQNTYAPHKVTPINNQNIIVEFETEENRNSMINKLEDSTGFKVKAQNKLRPMLMLKGINKNTNKEELIEIIKNQNPDIMEKYESEEDIKTKFYTNNKNMALYNTAIVVSPSIYGVCMEKQRINIDYQRVQVSEHVPLLQCFKCLHFRHTAKHCNNELTNCSHCAAGDHSNKNCPHKANKDKINCYNCKSHNEKYNLNNPTNHSATTALCPRKVAAAVKVKYSINYGN